MKQKQNLWMLASLILILLFIWGQSCLPVKQSANESSWLLEHLIHPLFRLVGLGEISQTLLRKLAHVAEFAVLGAVLVWFCDGRLWRSILFGFVAATLDESIQLLSGRGSLVLDIWIDLIGVALGSILSWLLVRRSRTGRAVRKTE